MSFTIWFTGFSGAGKSTLSRLVYQEIRQRNLKAELLDGDLIRTNFSSELGFARRDRDINVRRIGFISHLLNRNDVVSVVAAIAPFEAAREQNRLLLDHYVEVWCDCPLDVVEERDVKGLYESARSGEIEHFTGVSSPYEPPRNAEIVCHTSPESVSESVCKIIMWLEQNALIPKRAECDCSDYTVEDDEAWRAHLARLGYAKSR